MTRETFIKELDKILKRASAIEELEKLKTEFENKEGVFTSYHVVIAIEEHIKKLKGEE